LGDITVQIYPNSLQVNGTTSSKTARIHFRADKTQQSCHRIHVAWQDRWTVVKTELGVWTRIKVTHRTYQ